MSKTRQGLSIGRLLSISVAVACLAMLGGCDNPIENDDDESLACANSGDIWGAGDEGLVNGCQADSRFNNPANVEVAPDGTVYVADFDNSEVRVIAPNGAVSTLVAPANVLPLTFSRPFGLALAPDGFLYVQTDRNDMGAPDATATTGTLWRVDRGTGLTTVVARGISAGRAGFRRCPMAALR